MQKPWPAVERNADAPRVARKVEDRELRLKLLGQKLWLQGLQERRGSKRLKSRFSLLIWKPNELLTVVASMQMMSGRHKQQQEVLYSS
jgi:hypothetical protein